MILKLPQNRIAPTLKKHLHQIGTALMANASQLKALRSKTLSIQMDRSMLIVDSTNISGIVGSAGVEMLDSIITPQQKSKPAVIEICDNLLISETLSLPAEARKHIAQAIESALDELTPLKPESSYYDYRIIKEDEQIITIGIIATKKAPIDNLIAALSRYSITVEKVCPSNDYRDLNLLTRGVHARNRSLISAAILAGILTLCLVAFVIMPALVQQKKIEMIKNDISSIEARAKRAEATEQAVKTIENEFATIRQFRNDKAVTNTLRSLGDILPESAYINRLKIDRKNIEIEGFAQSAAGILPALEASGKYTKAEFTAPSTRDMKNNTDRFTLKAEVRHE